MFTDSDLDDHPVEAGEGHAGSEFDAAEHHDESPDHIYPNDHHTGSDHLESSESLDLADSDVSHGVTGGSDLVLTGPHGHQIDLGEADISWNGGANDAVAVQAQDGSTEVYIDNDHNGTVDEAIRIDSGNHFSVWSSDGHGGWALAATGHIDASGQAQVDAHPDQHAAAHAPSAVAAAEQAGTTGHTPTSTEHTPTTTGHTAGENTSTSHYPGVAAGDLAVADGDKYIDAGPAKYDLDGDGKPETAVVESDGKMIQVSDTDGDGRADEMLEVDPSTHQASIYIDDGEGHWEVAATGHIDPSGDFVEDGSAETQDTSDESAGTHDIVYTSADGTRTDLGAPNQDLDGDGKDESVAVQASDGTVVVLSDVNGDGQPDQIISVDPSGHATWAVPDGHGGWEVVQTAQINADGTVVPDSSSGDAPTTAHDTDSAGDDHTATPHHSENMSVSVGGQSFDAGEATIDTDKDGVPDTVQVPGPSGTTLYYEDTNGDGVADKAWTTDTGGHVTATYELNASGAWASVEAGERA